jgi:hypothetical protein
MILSEFKPQSVTVEVKKFVIPQARHVSVKSQFDEGPNREMSLAFTRRLRS